MKSNAKVELISYIQNHHDIKNNFIVTYDKHDPYPVIHLKLMGSHHVFLLNFDSTGDNPKYIDMQLLHIDGNYIITPDADIIINQAIAWGKFKIDDVIYTQLPKHESYNGVDLDILLTALNDIRQNSGNQLVIIEKIDSFVATTYKRTNVVREFDTPSPECNSVWQSKFQAQP